MFGAATHYPRQPDVGKCPVQLLKDIGNHMKENLRCINSSSQVLEKSADELEKTVVMGWTVMDNFP